MIPEIDIWRSAQLMIRQYGDAAASEADARALTEQSDSAGGLVRTHRNKFIAHAADERSRRVDPLDRFGLSLNEIAEAQRIVIRIATAIGSHILYDTALGGVVPTPQFNVFENLEMPVIPAANMDEIGDWWHTHESERDNWLQERIDLITGQITPMT